MWLVSAFYHLSSSLTGASAFSILRQSMTTTPPTTVYRTLSSSKLPHRGLGLSAKIAGAASIRHSTTALNGGDDGTVYGTFAPVPDDVASLLQGLYALSPSPRVCLSAAGSGGKAISWMLGVPGASACLLEATVPYSSAASNQQMGGGPPKGRYCSPEVAERLARTAYARAIDLCVAGSSKGTHAISEAGVIGVGCTAVVASSKPKKGSHRCFVCAQTHDGITHYQLFLSKGHRNRAGEDAAVSRVVLQAIAEAAGLAVPNGFKSDHLVLETTSGGSVRESDACDDRLDDDYTENGLEPETVPMGRYSPEPDAIQALVDGRSEALLMVPKLREGDDPTGRKSGRERNAGTSSNTPAAAAAPNESTLHHHHQEVDQEVGPMVVTLRDEAAKAALSRNTTVVLPGSYNPLHRGHLRLLQEARALHAEICRGLDDGEAAEAAARAGEEIEGEEDKRDGAGRAKVPVHAVFEVSIANADKGGLSAEEVRRRALQFTDPEGVGRPVPVVLTRAPLFSQKARLFPGCTFVVGADTAKRLVNTKYYGNSQVEMVAALSEIRYLGCSFIVGGRKGSDGRFETLEDVLDGKGLPESVRCMFHGLDEETFREDLSSTSIRAGKAKAGL